MTAWESRPREHVAAAASSHAGLPNPFTSALAAGNCRLPAPQLGSTARPPNDSLVSAALAAGLAAEPRQALCPDPFQVPFRSNEVIVSMKYPLKALPLRAQAAPKASPPHSAGEYQAAAGRAGGELILILLHGKPLRKKNKKNKFPV